MTDNRITTSDEVKLEIYSEGKCIDTYESSGYSNIPEFIFKVFSKSSLDMGDIEDYVFRVTNITRGTTSRYRVNAGGNVKLIPEEPVEAVLD